MKQSLLCLCVLLLCSPNLYAQEDKTGAPYFIVQGKDLQGASFPLTHVAAEVQIVGIIADVTIRQVYQNKSTQTLEAIYVFPASTKAAVYAMQMQVGKERIQAKIKEKQEARNTYEQAKTAGKTTSLLEQDRANIFKMSVGNILPQDSIVVELRYTELITPNEGEYAFSLPTVVGPRYKSVYDEPAANNSSTNLQKDDYQKADTKPTYTYSFSMRVAAGVPVENLYSPSHKIITAPKENGEQHVLLADEKQGNKDIVVRYSLRGAQMQQGLLAYQEDGEKFFLYMAQPPKRQVAVEPTPREYIFVVDISGSMHGFPLEVSKKLISNLLKGLKPTDKFNILFFAGGSQTLHESSVEASPENIEKAQKMLTNIIGSGGTEILPAVERALAFPRKEGFARSFVILTDGYIGVEKKVFQLIRNSLGDANFFSFGIGSAVNRLLIEGMAFVGNSEPTIVLNESEAEKAAQKFHQYINNPILTDIKINFGEMQVYDQEPARFPDLFAEKPVIVFGKYKGELKGEITLSGRQGGKAIEQKQDIAKTKPKNKNQAIRYLWARERIKLIGDYNLNGYDNRRYTSRDSTEIKEITRLGLQYNLLTDYTSFVAVYDKVRNSEAQKDTTITQPLPLPEGMSDFDAQLLGRMSGLSISASGSLDEVVVTGYALTTTGTFSGSAVRLASKNLFTSERIIKSLEGAYFIQSPILINGYRLQGNLASTDNPYWYRHDLQLTTSIHRQVASLELGYDNPLRRMEIAPLLYHNNKKGLLAFQTTEYLENSLVLKKNFRLNQKLATRVYAAGTWNPIAIDRNGDEFLDTPKGYTARFLQDWQYKTDKTELNLAYQYTRIDQAQGHKNYNLPLALDNKSHNAGMALNWTERVGKGEFILQTYLHDYQLSKRLGSPTYDDARSYKGTERKWGIESGYRFKNGKHNAEAKLAYMGNQVSEILNYNTALNNFLHLQRQESVVGSYLRYTYHQEEELAWKISPALRIDYHNLFGWLVSPEANLYASYHDFSLNGYVGRRYRAANVLAENANYWASQRSVVLSETPQAEKSWHYSIGSDYHFRLGGKARSQVGLTYQHTQFQNQIIVNAFTSPHIVWIGNLQGKAFQDLLLGRFSFDYGKLDVDMIYQWQRNRATYNQKLRDVPFAPTSSLKTDISFDITNIKGGTLRPALVWLYTGKQIVPQPNILEEPRAYHTFDIRLQYIKTKWELNIGCENIGDFRLQQTIRYDASQLWATTLGRRMFAGILWKF